ncbi:hypothetical protein AERO8C_80203 [Aeromonas veronii]|uniref:Uncharacterized protein n=1 Tax=Aeromonas veronii TaxID=654 RepID=A0A653LDU5_AERVE|nr:hypothetical protein AERO8C_80203 [Aeromonas veronii]
MPLRSLKIEWLFGWLTLDNSLHHQKLPIQFKPFLLKDDFSTLAILYRSLNNDIGIICQLDIAFSIHDSIDIDCI